jgi:hypothetical protein
MKQTTILSSWTRYFPLPGGMGGRSRAKVRVLVAVAIRFAAPIGLNAG